MKDVIHSTTNQTVSLLLLTGLLIAIGLQFLDIFGSNSTVKNTIGISSIVIAVIFCAIAVFVRSKWQFALHKSIIKPIQILSAFFLVTGLLLGVWEFLTPANYVYSLTKINPERLVFLSHFLIIMFISAYSSSNLKKITRKYAFLFPLWIIGLTAWIQLLPFDSFARFAHEDGPVETIQFFIVLSISILSINKALSASVQKSKVVFMVIGILSFFVAMEEISWGQRILGIETPEKLKEINVQDETTLHNIGIFNQLQIYAYILIALVGTILPQIRPNLFIKNTFLPINTQSIFLVFPVVFYIYSLFSTSLFHWAEIIEVHFYFGLLVWVYNTQLSFNTK